MQCVMIRYKIESNLYTHCFNAHPLLKSKHLKKTLDFVELSVALRERDATQIDPNVHENLSQTNKGT